MLTKEQVLHYWNYAEILNEELGKTAQFVEPDAQNYSTYSLMYTKIILSACAEVEIICRMLCQIVDSNRDYTTLKNQAKMRNLSETIQMRFPNIYQARSELVQKQEYIYPFKVWKEDPKKNLQWWEDYNQIKHYRYQKYNSATLENALNSVSALIILNSYLYEMITGTPTPRMTRQGMFDNCYSYCGLIVQPSEKLPDM